MSPRAEAARAGMDRTKKPVNFIGIFDTGGLLYIVVLRRTY
jgi:hypothetical protein